MTWLIPPLAGQKVTLNPAIDNYQAHVNHHKATDGVIVNDVSLSDWLLYGKMSNSLHVIFPNGREYKFNQKEIMPISGAFYEFTTYNINNSRFEHGLTPDSRERIEGYIVHDGKSFMQTDVNKESRLAQLEKAVDYYNHMNTRDMEEKQVNEINQRYASVLEEIAVTKEREAQEHVEEEQPSKKKTPPRPTRTYVDRF